MIKTFQKFPLIHAFIVLACLTGGTGLAEESPAGCPPIAAVPDEVEQYSRELGIVSTNPVAGAGVEALLRLGRDASDALVRRPKGDGLNVMEQLNDEEFQDVSLKMKGFLVNREETVYVEPDPEFFASLAKRTGDQVSVDFFDVYGKTIRKTWPVYIEQQTDYSGCIRYGTTSLVDAYARWDTYRKKYPARYAEEVTNFIVEIEDYLASGTCACADKQSVVRELKAFIRAFPGAGIAPRIKERINEIRRGKSDVREHCQSG